MSQLGIELTEIEKRMRFERIAFDWRYCSPIAGAAAATRTTGMIRLRLGKCNSPAYPTCGFWKAFERMEMTLAQM